jgi:mono/diheme cytochrome c family protein
MTLGLVQRSVVISAMIAAVLAVVANSPTWPQAAGANSDPGTDTSADKGHAQFLANCAECHGADAKGAGPRSAELKVKPADLTLLAERNNGVFAAGAIYQLIDGRHGRSNHISGEMPIWGCRHLEKPAESPAFASPIHRHGARHATRKKPRKPDLDTFLDLSCDSEAMIQSRILSIVGYLSLIQQR